MRDLKLDEIPDLALGVGVLGGGGGGDPYLGQLLAQALIRETGPIQLWDVDEAPADALVVASAYMGAPMVMAEKLPQGDKAARAFGADRLRNKTAREAIIHAIGRDFNLTPIIAEAYFSQVATYFSQHADVTLATGQICYEAVSAAEPPSKHIALAARVSVRLTLFDPHVDLTVLAEYGLAGLRRHRILRMTREAIDQGALLSYEDLAMILTTSPATVRRDARAGRSAPRPPLND